MGSYRQEPAETGRKGLPSCAELSFAFPSPGFSCRFSGDVCETRKAQWGWKGTVGR